MDSRIYSHLDEVISERESRQAVWVSWLPCVRRPTCGMGLQPQFGEQPFTSTRHSNFSAPTLQAPQLFPPIPPSGNSCLNSAEVRFGSYKCQTNPKCASKKILVKKSLKRKHCQASKSLKSSFVLLHNFYIFKDCRIILYTLPPHLLRFILECFHFCFMIIIPLNT